MREHISNAHLLRDIALWFIAFLWFCQFVADHKAARKRNRRLGDPSKDCERTGQFEVSMGKRWGW